MGFDINPLGHKMHLQQLDREAAKIHRYARTGNTVDRRQPRDADKPYRWVARVTQIFSKPRFAD